MYRRRRTVVVLSLLFLVVAGVWGTGVFGKLTGAGFEDPGSESSRAAEVAERELGRDAADVVVLYSQRRPHRRRPGVPRRGRGLPRRAAAGAARRHHHLLEHGRRAAGQRGPAGHVRRPAARRRRRRRRGGDRDRGRPRRGRPHDATGGDAAVDRDISEQRRRRHRPRRDDLAAGPAGAARRRLRQPGRGPLPLAIGGTAILGAFTALRVVSGFTDVSVFAVNVVTLLGLGPGDRLRAVRGQPVPRGARPRSPTVEDAVARTWRPPAARSPSPGRPSPSRSPGCSSSRRCSCGRWASAA